jgi:predicted transposase YbfD/YdcC
LNEEVRLFLETEAKKKSSIVIEDSHEDFDKGHGRIETRKCFVSSQIDWLTQKEQWVGLKTIAMIVETQEVHGKASTEQRFFISSLPPTAERIASAVRSHWLIEKCTYHLIGAFLWIYFLREPLLINDNDYSSDSMSSKPSDILCKLHPK